MASIDNTPTFSDKTATDNPATSPFMRLPPELRQQILTYASQEVSKTSNGQSIRLLDYKITSVCRTIYEDALELANLCVPKSAKDTLFQFDDLHALQNIARIILTYQRLVRTSRHAAFEKLNVEIVFFGRLRAPQLGNDALFRSLVDPNHVSPVSCWPHSLDMRSSRGLSQYIQDVRINLSNPDLSPIDDGRFIRPEFLRYIREALTGGLKNGLSGLCPHGRLQVVGSAPFYHENVILLLFNEIDCKYVKGKVGILSRPDGHLQFEFGIQFGKQLGA